MFILTLPQSPCPEQHNCRAEDKCPGGNPPREYPVDRQHRKRERDDQHGRQPGNPPVGVAAMENLP
ncbi:hypothetical protein [Paraburkholderia adhaesiva]|uniref:hypothetical protein n=1 Tax=Paraburkholderia adhaesiva TaxID=2883244 RepID=UPI0027E50B7C|nr:hypothetical protein [Paraburkholderia adhaesiva]